MSIHGSTPPDNEDGTPRPRELTISDPINPDHYKDEDGKECWEAMVEEFGKIDTFTFFRLNAFKYRFRAGKKGPKEEDLKKAIRCEELALEICRP